jgi:hypothetical protein
MGDFLWGKNPIRGAGWDWRLAWPGRPLSMDLRLLTLAAIDAGLRCRTSARFLKQSA